MRALHSTLVTLTVLVAGCAQLSVYPLEPGTEQRKSDAQEGLRFYRPQPYLFVTRLPSAGAPANPQQVVQNNGQTDTQSAKQKKSTRAATTQGGGSAGGGGSQGGGSTATPTNSGADVSFVAQNDVYVMRLVYLPDFSKPYVLSASPGLFGTASLSPQLQDGWMLTSLNGSVDNRVPETLSSIASVLSAIKPSPSVGGGGSQRSATIEGGLAGEPADVLPPGLYKLVYDGAGQLIGLRRVTGFCSSAGIVPNESALPDKCAPKSATPLPKSEPAPK